jgi:WD40 repeat protein
MDGLSVTRRRAVGRSRENRGPYTTPRLLAFYWPDESVIVSFGSGGGGSDRTIALSNASGNPDPRRLQARQAGGSVSSISVGKQGGLAIGDQNGEVLRWSPEARYSGRLSAGMFYISAVLVDDSNRRLLTASGDGFVRSWPLDTTRWIAMACAKANRAWEPQEWRELLPDDPYIASCTEKTPRRSWSIGN